MAELRPIDPNKVFNEIPSLKAQVRGLSATAKGIAKTAGTAGAPIPIPDINEEAKKILEIEKQKLINAGKQEIILYLLEIFSEFVADNPPPVDEIVEKINPMIDGINKLIGKLKAALDFLSTQLSFITNAMAILLTIYIATKIISLVPVPVVAFGAGVGFSQFISLALEINQGIGKILAKISTIAFSILSVMLMILNMFSYLGMIVGIISNFLSTMMGLLNSLINDSLKTADDWANTSTFESDMEKSNNNLNKTGDENQDERLNLMNQINNLQLMMGNGLVGCQLPDGSVEQLSPEECLSRGGTILDSNLSLANLQNLLNGLGGPLDGFNGVITSLLNLNEDVTIEKATDNKGKRYGFYQSDIKNNRRV
tara:strand:- start:373 stop:1479 length:1107 start_codon:yes stop_codon:yes gene_type:complete